VSVFGEYLSKVAAAMDFVSKLPDC